jgi:hypothetical protein
MTNNFLNFIVLDENNDPVLNEQDLPKLLPRPATKTTQDIERLIALNKPVEVINKFAELVCLGEQWDWAQSYQNYLVEKYEVEQYNANLPEPIENDEGELVEPTKKEIPAEPGDLQEVSVSDVLAPYQSKINKAIGIGFKGINVSLTEANQNGLSALKSALDLAVEFGVKDQFFPINFNADTPKGTQIVKLLDEDEFKQFGFNFILARKSLFESKAES